MVTVLISLLAGAAVLFMCGLVVRRGRLRHREQRRAAIEDRLRPAAYELLSGSPAPDGLDGEEAKVFEGLLVRYGRLLRGEGRSSLAAYFEATGTVERQLRRLADPRSWRRATAASMLGDLGSHRADADLVRALGDPNQDVRMAAAHSLGRLQVPGAVAPLLNAMAAGGLPRGVGSAAVVAIGTPAVPHLLEHARGGSGEGRVTAAELLGQIGDPSSTPTLLVLLRDPAPAARAAAAHAFERLADDQAAEALAVALGDTEPAVRVAAATALGHVGGGAFDHLIAVARTDSFEPARAAAEAAARLDPDRVASAGSAPNAGPHLQEAADRIRMLR